MPRITYLPWDFSVNVESGTTVFAAAPKAGVIIPTACNAQATCGLCRVRIVAGEENLPPMSAVEHKHLGNVYFLNQMRLSCQIAVTGDVTVYVPDAPSET